MEVLLLYIAIVLVLSVIVKIDEIKRCAEKQMKHNEFWESRGVKPFIDFCK